MSESALSLPDRRALRQRLIALRQSLVAGADAPAAAESLGRHLATLMTTLEPTGLGLYWPMRGEFNPAPALEAVAALREVPWALPYCRREPREMHFRRWDRVAPRAKDETGIAASDGPPLQPDVILAPCVGFTPEGYRLGYGGGYFDRYLAAHPAVTVIGVAWACGEIGPGDYAAEAHDLPLTLVVTEHGVFGG